MNRTTTKDVDSGPLLPEELTLALLRSSAILVDRSLQQWPANPALASAYLCSGIELALKGLLARRDWRLLYDNPELASLADLASSETHTIEPKEALSRLPSGDDFGHRATLSAAMDTLAEYRLSNDELGELAFTEKQQIAYETGVLALAHLLNETSFDETSTLTTGLVEQAKMSLITGSRPSSPFET